MKRVLQFLLLLLYSIPSNAAESGDSIGVFGIKPIYFKGEPIKFKLSNTTNSDIFVSFSLSLFSKEQNDWIEQVPDLENYNCNPQEKLGVNFSLLKAHDYVIVEWFPKKANRQFCFNWTKNKGKYRIIVRYRPKVEPLEKQRLTNLMTSTFIIK